MSRRLKHWGWGYEDQQPAPEAVREIALGLRAHLGFGDAEIDQPVPLEQVDLRAPRLDPPATLEGIAAVDDYARASHALGAAYMQQIRFPDASEVTRAAIDLLGDDPADPLLARLRALHAWSIAANGGRDGVAEEADLALAAARAGGDAERELDVLEPVDIEPPHAPSHVPPPPPSV